MNLNHLEGIALTQKIAFTLNERVLNAVEVVVLPPFVDLRSVQTLVDGDRLLLGYGAQDVSPHPDGAYTGDISVTMLGKLGCSYVVVGHSERRQYHHEDDALVNAKTKAVIAGGMIPILCLGETLDVREASEHLPHCTAQLDGGLAGLTAEQVASTVIAYEPVWAIGTGRTATPADAQQVCAAVRARVAERYSGEVAEQIRILYGGSVKAANASELLAQADVDGALVGGASLDANEFAGICVAAAPGR
ncbi:MAG: triose-phosphate isomerase [Actinobacteria bacterium]|nr:triose-phosphate isomerase [Actinomycetota bacterium]